MQSCVRCSVVNGSGINPSSHVRWLAEMTSEAKDGRGRGRIPNEALRREAPTRRSVQKDLHLVEAALIADKIVVSLDELARNELALDACAAVMWVNPVDAGGHVIYWLNKGRGAEWRRGNVSGTYRQ